MFIEEEEGEHPNSEGKTGKNQPDAIGGSKA